MSDKKTFTMRKEWLEQFSKLTNEEAGELIKAIFTYKNTGEIPEEMSPAVTVVFSFMKKML